MAEETENLDHNPFFLRADPICASLKYTEHSFLFHRKVIDEIPTVPIAPHAQAVSKIYMAGCVIQL